MIAVSLAIGGILVLLYNNTEQARTQLALQKTLLEQQQVLLQRQTVSTDELKTTTSAQLEALCRYIARLIADHSGQTVSVEDPSVCTLVETSKPTAQKQEDNQSVVSSDPKQETAPGVQKQQPAPQEQPKKKATDALNDVIKTLLGRIL
jgi:hypothetical protein